MLEEGSFRLIMLLLSTALGLSFLIERLLEFLNGLFKKLAFSDLDWFEQKDELASLQISQQDEEQLTEADFNEQYSPVLFTMNAMEARNTFETVQRFWLQLIGVLAGIAVCWLAKFGLFGPLGAFEGLQGGVDWVLTGVLIGGGSQPIHFLIKFLNQRRVVEAGPPEILPVVTPAGVIVDLGDDPDPFFKILDVPYEGGYRPDTLENRNFRPAAPDLIVYHHTALHSDASFLDVVREIVEVKGWSTGYHTVVADDGTINNFCRWDRTGVHALGVNSRSLGIALNGNFHAQPGDPFSNDSGQFGNLRPTDSQLLSAAKVVALWCHLYNIPVKFGETIVSHREVRATACSGSNFPYEAFEALVKNCFDAWQSHDAQTELIFYKQKQRIFA